MTEERFARWQQEMVARLHGPHDDPLAKEIREAFLRVPRHRYLPRFLGLQGPVGPAFEEVLARTADEAARAVYSDHPLPVVGREQTHRSTSSAPGVMWWMLSRLEPREGHRVLEIGTGSGYNAALLSHLVGPEGRVVSLECIEEAAEDAAACLRLEGRGNVRVVSGDGAGGCPEEPPFDRVIVTAAAPDIHPAWFRQLADGGRLVCVLGGLSGTRIAWWERRGGRLVGALDLRVSFVPLTGPQAEYPAIADAREALRRRFERLARSATAEVPLGGPAWYSAPELLTALEVEFGAYMVLEGLGLGAALLGCADGCGVARVPLKLGGEGAMATCYGEPAIVERLLDLSDRMRRNPPDPQAGVAAIACPLAQAHELPAGGGPREHFAYSLGR